jgi:hypothetical protein
MLTERVSVLLETATDEARIGSYLGTPHFRNPFTQAV